MTAGSLGPIGLSSALEAAYELLIDRPASTAADLSPAWDRTEPLHQALATLESRGLAATLPGSPPTYTAVAPDIALDVLLTADEERLRAARGHAHRLAASYRRAGVLDGDTVIEVVAGRRVVAQAVEQVQHMAREQLRCAAPLGGGVSPSSLHPGVDCRLIYEGAAVDQPGVLDGIRQLVDAGAHARMLPTVPTALYLADDRRAVLPVHRGLDTTDAAIVVHATGLLDALSHLFEALWKRALPLPLAAPNGGLGPRGVDDRLVALLLSGLTDAAVARQLGIGFRTGQRRVAALMSELGAHTRFQAGVQVARRRLAGRP